MQILVGFLCLAILSGCSLAYNNAATTVSETAATAIKMQTYVYECPDDFGFVARIENDKAWLFLPGNTLDLPRVASVSGTKYASGSITFWREDDFATIETDSISRINCNNNRARAIWEHAKLNGVDFRATGNEPGWYLEISNKEDILLVTDYGQRTYQFNSALMKSKPPNATTVYNARNNDDMIEIVIKRKPCQDSMSDESFPANVSIVINNKRYSGCGKALH